MADYVQFSPKDHKELVVLHLTTIKFLQRDEQFVGFSRRVQDWLQQWTVQNNFKPVVLCNDSRSMWEALSGFWEEHRANVVAHFGHMIPKEYRDTYSYGLDWSLEYSVQRVNFGEGFYYDGATRTETTTPKDIIDVLFLLNHPLEHMEATTGNGESE